MPPHRAAPIPSSIKTSGGKVKNIAGQKLIGASARVDAAPARNAISILRHPQARMTAVAGLDGFTASTSLAFAVNCVRRGPERQLILPYRLAGRRRPPPYYYPPQEIGRAHV